MEGGTTSALPGQHGMASGRLTKMVQSEELETTWQHGTPSNQVESLSWARSRYGGVVRPPKMKVV